MNTYLEPALPLLLLLGFAGVIRAWRQSAKGRRPWLNTFVICGITLLSMNVSAWMLSRPLEAGYGNDALPHQGADAIVVLAGAVSPPSPSRPYLLPAPDTYRRVRHAAWLFHASAPRPILVSGGPRHAEAMRHVLLSEGVPAAMIWIEPRSTNTHENALYSSEMLRARGVTRILLVIEASSMPRAALSFRKQGMIVVPAPVRRTHLSGDLSDILPGWAAIESNGETIHELGGLLWYKLRGWI